MIIDFMFYDSIGWRRRHYLLSLSSFSHGQSRSKMRRNGGTTLLAYENPGLSMFRLRSFGQIEQQ